MRATGHFSWCEMYTSASPVVRVVVPSASSSAHWIRGSHVQPHCLCWATVRNRWRRSWGFKSRCSAMHPTLSETLGLPIRRLSLSPHTRQGLPLECAGLSPASSLAAPPGPWLAGRSNVAARQIRGVWSSVDVIARTMEHATHNKVVSPTGLHPPAPRLSVILPGRGIANNATKRKTSAQAIVNIFEAPIESVKPKARA